MILAAVLVRPYGVLGVCLAVAIPGFIMRGLCQWLFGCRLLQVSPVHYVKTVFVPVTALALIPIATFDVLVGHWAPATWGGLVGFGLLYVVLYACVLAPYVLGAENALEAMGSVCRLLRKQSS